MTWKGYFQSMPYVDPSKVVGSGPGANGPYTFKWPSNTDALYASKHNPFVNFSGTQGDLSQMVPDNQLGVICSPAACRTTAWSSQTNATTCTAPAAVLTPTP